MFSFALTLLLHIIGEPMFWIYLFCIQNASKYKNRQTSLIFIFPKTSDTRNESEYSDSPNTNSVIILIRIKV